MGILKSRGIPRATSLVLLAVALLVGCAGLPVPPPPPATGAPASDTEPLTTEDLAAATYRGIYEDQVVELTDGQYEGEPFVEAGASRPTVTLTPFHAFGDLNGDGAEDAVALLVESSGGSGSFWYLAAVLNQSGKPENVATLLMGDRLQVESVGVDGGTITVDAVTHAPDDPMCCPSQESTLTYEFRAGELVETTP